MERRYFLHRISHESEASYPLFYKEGYLSIGWCNLMDTDILEKINDGGEPAFNDFMHEHGISSRSRWNLWYFSQFNVGDYVVVPLYGKQFAICEVLEKPKSVLSLCGMQFPLDNGSTATITKDGLKKDGADSIYDLGFLIKVDLLRELPRDNASALLISRMKIRQATARIDDLKASVEEVIHSEGPISLQEKLITSISNNVKETIKTYITPDKLEQVLVWYMKKKGADRAWIPAKNEPGKESGADADIIAEFDDLGLVFYIQVKKHDDNTETSDWAVWQINEYTQQKQDTNDSLSYIPWVVTTAGSFSEKAIEMAAVSGVRLIDANELIRMIFNVGLDGIDE